MGNIAIVTFDNDGYVLGSEINAPDLVAPLIVRRIEGLMRPETPPSMCCNCADHECKIQNEGDYCGK